jgi:hypothetical protein
MKDIIDITEQLMSEFSLPASRSVPFDLMTVFFAESDAPLTVMAAASTASGPSTSVERELSNKQMIDGKRQPRRQQTYSKTC